MIARSDLIEHLREVPTPEASDDANRLAMPNSSMIGRMSQFREPLTDYFSILHEWSRQASRAGIEEDGYDNE
jgi:hypothetical protein